MYHLENWSEAANRLGVELGGPLVIDLPDGRKVEAQMLVPQFGTNKGTLVFSDAYMLSDLRPLIELGYAYSVFDGGLQGKPIADDDLIDILRDWCWCGDHAATPSWLSE